MQNNICSNKKKSGKHGSGKAFLGIVCVLVLVFVLVRNQESITAAALSGNSILENDESIESGGISDKAQSTASGGVQVRDEGDWQLVLVNKWNPVERDLNIEFTELSNGELVDSRMYPQLQLMFDDMRSEGVYPTVAAGYRTTQQQQYLYDSKFNEYIAQGYSQTDAKAQTELWVAVPGTSEHHLGLAVDINADGIHSYGSEVYSWLAQNAYRYGFIYRYQEGKTDITGIAAEPWHYRYVGVEAATEIFMENICLEEYLGAV